MLRLAAALCLAALLFLCLLAFAVHFAFRVPHSALAATVQSAIRNPPFDLAQGGPSMVEGPQSAISVKGRLSPPGRAKSAFLWERASDRKVPVAIDPKTGAFEATDLPLGLWDLVVETPWGRLEGVDMTPILSEYDVLIPPEYRTEDLGLPAKGEFTAEDRQWIERQVLEVKRYESRVRILALRGTADVAVVLVELTQEQPFVGEKGDEVTWRVEKWIYEKKYGGWAQFRTRVLYRRRVPRKEWESWGWQFEPALGGFAVTEDRKEPVVVEFEIPERPVPEKGLVGNKSPPSPGKGER